MDHRDCGAYKVILGEDFARDPARETSVHATKLRELRGRIKSTYPALGVELLLMALDGKVEVIERRRLAPRPRTRLLSVYAEASVLPRREWYRRLGHPVVEESPNP